MTFSIKKFISIFIVAVMLTSSCTIPHSSIYVDNSACAQSIAKNIFSIVIYDFPKDKKILNMRKESFIQDIKRVKEFKSLSFWYKENEYEFMINNKDNICWLNLYYKKSRYLEITNMLTFIKSKKISFCKCGGVEAEVTL